MGWGLEVRSIVAARGRGSIIAAADCVTAMASN